MKEGWTYKKFADCIDKIPKQRQVKSKDYKSTGLYPIVSQEKELISGYWDDESYLYKHSKPIIIFGDHTKVVKYVDFDFVVGADGTQILSPKSDVDAKFFYYTLLATPIRTLGYARHFKLLKERSFKFPSLSEQQHIVSRLDSAFAHIDELKANAEKQLSEARALFQKALTKAMEPKEGWEKKKMKEIAQVKIGPFGSLLHKRDYISGGIPLVNPIHMIEGKIVANNDYTISEEKAKELSAYLLRTNDVIFARRGEIGRCAIVSSNEDGFLCGTGSLFVRFKAKVDNAFMQMLFQSEVCKNYLLKSASGATMLNINAGIVEEMPLTIPSLSEQQRIVSRLDSLSAHVRELEEVLQKTIAECDALKQALLRQVFE